MKPELLSPAGSFDSLKAAVSNGADAVYLGGRLFNARQYASNFDDFQLTEAINYAHLRNVKIYLTLNTLIKNDELQLALEYAAFAYSIGVDAVIIQDIGFSQLLRRHIPKLSIHASTQMTIHNKQGVEFLLKNGFDRIVLPRELSLQEIGEIKRSTGAKLEAFVHGALCVCYSGQCHLSSAIGNKDYSKINYDELRSGNRGTCAQPCRLKYKLKNEKDETLNSGYLLSTKDICTIEHIPELIKGGIDSFKIEGRMKSPEYVGIVTSKYRKAIDAVYADNTIDATIQGNDRNDLLQIFNRGGFFGGYFFGRDMKNTIFQRSPKNMGLPLGTLISYNPERLSAHIKLTHSLSLGDGIEILTDSDNLPGGLATGIIVNGKFVKEAFSGQIAEVSRIKIDKSQLRNLSKYPLSVIKTSSRKLNEAISETFNSSSMDKKLPIDLEIVFLRDQPLKLTLSASSYYAIPQIKVIAKSDHLPESATGTGLSQIRLTEQFSKTDTFPFYINSCNISFESGLHIPLSEINALRRTAFSELCDKIISYGRPSDLQINKADIFPMSWGKNESITKSEHTRTSSPLISVLFYEFSSLLEQSDEILANINRIVLPVKYFSKENFDTLKKLKSMNISLTVLLPSVIRDSKADIHIIEMISRIPLEFIDEFMISNISFVPFIRKYGKKICADIGMNVYNRSTADFLSENKIDRFSMTPELSCEDPQNLFLPSDNKCTPELILYGRFPVMTTDFCPLGANFGEHPCSTYTSQAHYSLEDKTGQRYPIICNRYTCRPEILSSLPINLLSSSLEYFKNLGYSNFRINIFDENSYKVKEIIRAIKEGTV